MKILKDITKNYHYDNNMELTNKFFSAAMLVKLTARQYMKFILDGSTPTPPLIHRMLHGSAIQESLLEKLKYKEMELIIPLNNFKMGCSFDGVVLDNNVLTLMEIKTHFADDGINFSSSWHVRKTLLQAALYQGMYYAHANFGPVTFSPSIFSNSKSTLKTPYDLKDVLFLVVFYTMDNIKYLMLRFTKEYCYKIVNHYFMKANCIATLDWNVASDWDNEFKAIENELACWIKNDNFSVLIPNKNFNQDVNIIDVDEGQTTNSSNSLFNYSNYENVLNIQL